MKGPHVIPPSAAFPLHLKTYLESIMGDEGAPLAGQGGEEITCRGLGYGSAKIARRGINGFCRQSGTPNPFDDPEFHDRMKFWMDNTAIRVHRAGLYDLLDYLPKAWQAIQSTAWGDLKKVMAWAMRLLGIYIGARAGSQFAEYCIDAEDVLIPPQDSDLYYADGYPHYIAVGLRLWKSRSIILQAHTCWLKVIRNPDPKYQSYCTMRAS